MKQNISVEDLMELSEEQKEKLGEILGMCPMVKIPEISIGKMIEILEQKGEVYSINNMYVNIGTNKKGWGILLPSQNKEYRSDDLVTALWQAVKSIL